MRKTNCTNAANALPCQRGTDMNTAKTTILYSRLSKEDERENESLSIENQKRYLEDYAHKNGLTNIVHLVDDGWSGTRWDRPSFMQMMDMIESGQVGQICIKDMSRLGRDHLRVGLFLEQLRDSNIRLIAVAENIDTAKGEDDFMPFRNLFAEWHARDTSRKIRAINDARTKNGKRVSGAIPYGYLHDTQDRQIWILDEEAAPIVKRMFRGVIEGKTVAQIAEEFTAENLPTPTTHWTKIGAGMPNKPNKNPTRWAQSTIIAILKKEEYMGWKVLNKTKKENYKVKKREANPDGKLVFKDNHPAIVTEEEWNIVQRLRGTKRRKSPVSGTLNPLTGVLYCSDCGYKMYHKQGKTGRTKPHNEYVCTSYRHYSRECTIHYIRTEVVEELILDTIKRTCNYVRKNEPEFIKRVHEVSATFQETAIKESRQKLTKSKRRREEVSNLIKKLYESYALEKIPENHFTELLKGYDGEAIILDSEITRLQSEIDTFNTESVKADKFIELVKKHTEFKEFSVVLLNEFIEKVIIHEAEKINGKRTQQVDIYLNFIGKFELPPEEIPQEEPQKTIGSRGRKLRRDMTAEELEHEREIDRRYYARKRAKRIAAEQARRTEILQGTSFEVQTQESESDKIAI